MADFRVIVNDGGLSRRYAGADRIVGEELTRATDRNTIAGQGRSRTLAHDAVDTSRYRNSIAYKPAVYAGRVARGSWGTNLAYAPFIRFGRRAGAPPPPPGALLGWLRRHGIPESAEFAVAQAIARRGIPARDHFLPALRQLAPTFRREYQAAARRIVARLTGGGR